MKFNININKSKGPENIPARFLKGGALVLASSLTHIINLSITTSTVPKELKEATVKPLFKKGNRLDISHYRPVSILCIVSNILEWAVDVHIEDY